MVKFIPIYAVGVLLIGVFVYYNGYMSADSSYYLKAAQTFVELGGFTVVDDMGTAEPQWFSVWPIGYPLLVGGVAKLTGLDVFLASKALGLLFLLTNLALVYALFGQRTQPLALAVLILPSSLVIHSFTWSEAVFMCAMFASLLGVKWILHEHYRGGMLLLTAAMIMAFSARYTGLFVPVSLGLLALGMLGEDGKKRMAVLVPVFLACLWAAGYLYINLLWTGKLTGMERVSVTDSFSHLLFRFVSAINKDAMVFIPFLLLLINKWRDMRPERQDAHARLALFTLGLGVVYLALLFSLRLFKHFDPFTPRLTFPGTALIVIGLLQYYRPPPRFWQVLTAVLVLVHIGYYANREYKKGKMTENVYVKMERAVARYRSLPEDAVVIAANPPNAYIIGLPERYLRPGLLLIYPHFEPYFRLETWDMFQDRLAVISANHPAAACFLDFQPYTNTEEFIAYAQDKGFGSDVIRELSKRFQAHRFVPVDGCKL